MPTRALLEIVSAIEDLARPGREHGTTPPIVLAATRALLSNNAGASIRARQFCCGRCGALDRVVDGDVDRLEREAGAVKVEHWKILQCARKSRASNEGARRWLRVPCQ